MVDFKKKIKKYKAKKPIDPLEIYDSLDRASDKGPLRPVQTHILKKWHSELREQRDLIIKLHTGQGKTLIGLLMLQSRLNEKKGPALYLCPNRFLVEQICIQAKQFGISVVKAEDDLPDEFIASKAILVTTVQKMFNGLTKFGLESQSLPIGSFLMDDCHACIDTIKQSCSITLAEITEPYKDIIRLFASDLSDQGAGTFADLRNGEFDALLSIPYWSWIDHCDEVTTILSKHKHLNEIKFAWTLVRDMIANCICLASGTSIEIIPHSPPLQAFGSYFEAKHRIFMSATVTDDSFLVRGLGLQQTTIENPLTIPNEKWCGEKMLILPSLLDASLTREKIVSMFAKQEKGRTHGVVGLAPSFKRSELWEEKGAVVARTDSIMASIEDLKSGKCSKSLCIVNRYDGIDLPDDACRVLVIDSKPLGMSHYDRFLEACRPDSEVIAQRTARIIEQGLGRSVRGEKDYCAIVLAGADLVQATRSSIARKYYSSQTQTQIEIGLEIAEFAKDDIYGGEEPFVALLELVKKVLDRDDGWKDFYKEQMSNAKPLIPDKKMLEVFSKELKAEQKAESNRWNEAADAIQQLIDDSSFSDQEKGWYLQEKARYLYRQSKSESKKLQVIAHTLNRFLLKPQEGVTVKKLEAIPLLRTEAITKWIRRSCDFDDMMIRVDAILTDLRFGGDSDRFESAIQKLGESLGYAAERPDKEWKEGPDDLWCLRLNNYLLIECKNRVDVSRKSIKKEESGQMNNSCAWFKKNYKDASVHNLLIFPGKEIGKGAGFTNPVSVMRVRELRRLVRNVLGFFKEFHGIDLKELEPKRIQEYLNAHKLTTEDLTTQYSVAFSTSSK